jgi:hypothetical protein
MSQYTLDIISNHPDFSNKQLRKYNIDGIETVGAYGNEPFAIVFKNNSYQKVQVKLSMDGTDILTGELATTTASSKMWVVGANEKLELKAFPETNNGGSRFVFTSAENSVALNTHGDLSHRGIIAAAVFIEGYVQPYLTFSGYYGCGSSGSNYGSRGILRSQTICSSNSTNARLTKSYEKCSDSIDGLSLSEPESLVAIGAGEYTNQEIQYVTGLTKPVFSEVVRVKYMWWSDLEEKLQHSRVEDPNPTGFPGDKPIKNIDLSSVPKIRTKKASFKKEEQVFTRF